MKASRKSAEKPPESFVLIASELVGRIERTSSADWFLEYRFFSNTLNEAWRWPRHSMGGAVFGIAEVPISETESQVVLQTYDPRSRRVTSETVCMFEKRSRPPNHPNPLPALVLTSDNRTATKGQAIGALKNLIDFAGSKSAMPGESPPTNDPESANKQKGLELWNDEKSWPEVAEAMYNDRWLAGAAKSAVKRYATKTRQTIREGKPGSPPLTKKKESN